MSQSLNRAGGAVSRLYEDSGSKKHVNAASWLILYVGVTLLPLAVAAIDRPPGRDFWTEFSVALGFTGLSMLGLQFALTARLRRMQAPYGIDVLLQFHRQIAIVAFFFVLAHPALIVVGDPGRLGQLNPVGGPPRVVFAWASLFAFAIVVGTSVWRERLGLSYEWWRVIHGVLAVAGLALALGHVVGVGHYVGTPWKQALWAVMSVGVVGLLAYTRVVKPWMLIRRPWVVEEVREERGRSWTLTLRADGHDGIDFRPGQFAWLTIRNTPFSIRDHPFSFSSSSLRRDRVEMTIKELGDFTSTIGELRPGARAFLEGPYGAFTSDRYHGAGYAFIAGGVGITPVMSMLHTLDERGDTRPLLLILANNDIESVTFLDEIEAYERRDHITVVHVLDEPPEGWTGETGYVDDEVIERHLPEHHDQYEYFLCGPPPMMESAESALLKHGVALEQIHTERFDFI